MAAVNFLWIVLASLKYEFGKQIHNHAIAQRKLRQGVAAELAPHQVCNEMAKLLAHFKFIPSKIFPNQTSAIEFVIHHFCRETRKDHASSKRTQNRRER